MDIIPVLDIRNGVVVHARRGERASYAPLQSALLAGSDPAATLEALLTAAALASGRAPVAAYVADLDGIVDGSPQWALLQRLRRSAGVPLWVDAGVSDASAVAAAAKLGLVPVVGSESLRAADTLARLGGLLPPEGWLLSLDADAAGTRDPAGALQQPGLWPRRVIAMDLARVGSGAGALGDWLLRCIRLAPDRAWIAAGGVRSAADLEALDKAGVSAALVASALHDGSLIGVPCRRNPEPLGKTWPPRSGTQKKAPW